MIDDALNLARADKLEYDVALRLALTWAHETEYGPWKAFIRNMDFIKKMLHSEENADLYVVCLYCKYYYLHEIIFLVDSRRLN